MNFFGSNIFKTLEGPRKHVHGMYLALDRSFMTLIMLSDTHDQGRTLTHDSMPWERGQVFGENPVIIPLVSWLRAHALES